MSDQIFFVDLENVQGFELGKVPPGARIKVFVGRLQSKLPTALVQQTQALGSRLQWVRIDGDGPNALDFHIACHLGEAICKYPKGEFVIVSNDKGFDPLVRHLVARGFKCRRDGRVRSGLPRPTSHAQAVADHIRTLERSALPKKRATLINHLVAHFNKKLTAEEIKKAIEHLLETGFIAGSEAAVTYNF